jgi:hypothetical protein
MTRRIEFSRRTKSIIAGRAGYRCSLPDCGIITVGPGLLPDEIAITGTASHIFSASPGGPRGQGGLHRDRLSSPENGIWLCENHGKLVDNNQGNAYPPDLLISLKDLHEARIAREQGNNLSPFGWVQEINILRGPIFQTPARLRLGKVTLVTGRTATGKTAICDWLAGASDSRSLHAWMRRTEEIPELHYSVTYYSPTRHNISVYVTRTKIQYELDGVSVPYNPLPFSTVLFTDKEWKYRASPLEELGHQLSLDPLLIKNFISELDKRPIGLTRNARISASGNLVIDIQGIGKDLEYPKLSFGAQALVTLELAASIATFNANYHPTLFLMGTGIDFLDNKALEHLIRLLSSPRHKFQTVLVIMQPPRPLSWAGWEMAHFRWSREGVKIDQNRVSG